MTLSPFEPDTSLARVDDWVTVLESVADLANRIASTDLVPEAYRGDPATVAAIILRGRELGLPPMTALEYVYVVRGTVRLKAEAMRSLILAAGHELEFAEMTGGTCTIRGRRRLSEKWLSVTYTMDMARASGAANRNPTYKTHPRAMLAARATAELARLAFADVIGGLGAVEDADDNADADEPPKRTKLQRAWTAPRALESPLEAPNEPPEPDHTPEPVAELTEPRTEAPADGRTDLSDNEAAWRAIQDEWNAYEPPEPAEDDDITASDAQRKMLFALIGKLGFVSRELRLREAGAIIGRDLDSFNELTRRDAHILIDKWQILAGTREPG